MNAQVGVSSQFHNHNIDKLVDKVTNVFKLSAVQAMNSELNGEVYKLRPGKIKKGATSDEHYSVANVMADMVSSLDNTKKHNLRRMLGSDKEITNMIRLLGLDMRSSKPITEQMDLKHHFSFINEKTFSEDAVRDMAADLFSIQPVIAPDDDTLPDDGNIGTDPYDPPSPPIIINPRVEFLLYEVKCLDETNPEWPGNDKINCGAVAVDDQGSVSTINEFNVMDGFKDNVVKTYNPPKMLKSFPLNSFKYPKSFLVTLTLAEKDWGGFSKFLEELYKAIKNDLQKILNALGAAAAGALTGSVIAGPVGAIIGAIIGLLLELLFKWIIKLLKDDVFEPQSTSIIMPTANSTFSSGSLISSLMYFNFQDFGGSYRVGYKWKICQH